MKTQIIVWASLIFALTNTAAGQQPGGGSDRGSGGIRTTGEAVLQAEPDQVVVRLGVETRGETAESSVAENSNRTNAVIDKLRSEIGEHGSIQTSNFSIREDRRFDPRTERESSAGYVTTNTVVVRFADVGRAGEILDAAVQAGANNVQGVSFNLENDVPLRNRALAAAAAEAKSKAELLASSLGLTLGRILFVEDSQPITVQPFDARPQLEAARAGMAVPIEPGEVEVRAVVSLTHAIGR